MTQRYDIIIIGGGHNGLVAAATLAKAGRKTLVLEAQEHLGGLAATRPLGGLQVPLAAHLLYALHPGVERSLGLSLDYVTRALPTRALSAEGRSLTVEATELEQRLLRFAGALAPFRERPPPRPVGGGWADRVTLLKLGLALRRLGRTEMREFLRIALLNVYDLLNDHLDDELLKAALAWDALLGTHLAPRSPGGVLAWLYRLSGRAGGAAPLAYPKGGVGALVEALAGAARKAGAEIRTAAPVARILVSEDRATGVLLADGQEIAAAQVLSSADPKRTFLEFVGPPLLETGFVRQAKHIRARGLVGKLDLILEELPEGLPGKERLLLVDSLDALEEIYDGAKYGDTPPALAAEILVPTALEGRSGRQHLSALLTYLPTHPKAGLEAARAEAQAAALRLLDSRFPGLSSRVAESDLRLPGDYEAQLGLTGGDWHQGETTIEQLFLLRPLAGASQYRTPIQGLYLCGAGAHPGGHVTGLPGRNAAAVVLEEGKR